VFNHPTASQSPRHMTSTEHSIQPFFTVISRDYQFDNIPFTARAPPCTNNPRQNTFATFGWEYGERAVRRVAWMRMMGGDSVAYHERTIAGREDDPVASAAAYYASRGETPMVWGGRGRFLLGLDGEVDLDDYRAIFGPGGARHPATAGRLVGCRRPGLELVVSPPKSVAELGVIGRAEDMHLITDAERDATLDYLDRLVAERGGRRGRAQVPTSTDGLIWATARHATTRAGDPQVHDHVLIANAVVMGDTRGGWKGLDTAFLCDHLHAATGAGRMAAAAKAVELGYGIEADPGPSGRLGGWAITGIPAAVCEAHSTRSAQITAAVGADASYAARSVAARATRDRKAHEPVPDLMARWQRELTAAGHPPVGIAAAVDAAGTAYRPPTVDLDELAGGLLAPGGRLAGAKTFTRSDVIVAVAPHLHGLALPVLDEAVEAVLAHPDAVRLPVVTGAREAVWAAACVLADEERIAALAETLTARASARVPPELAFDAVDAVEGRLGGLLTVTQREVAVGLMTGGHGLDVVIGIAGSGKTTTLSAVRAGFETAGYSVVGTATSGQAAKNLAEGGGIEARTIASLTWRIDHGTMTLTNRHVVICDEVGMTADVDLARLFGAVERAGGKMIVVGDDRQLDPVGPGGALAALTERHPDHVWELPDNLRQTNPGERTALADLRHGDVAAAVAWYSQRGRIRAVDSRARAVRAMVRAWASDAAAGHDTLLLAYRRDNVDALNRAARHLLETAGLLSGPELTAPGGRRYRAGDLIVTLAPGPRGAWVTSQPAEITAVNPHTQELTAVTPDGLQLQMGPDDIGADRLAHGYAITAHRAQGATVDVAHVLDDGGGRELAYVAMSRAREASHVYVTAANQHQAAERLTWAWEQQRRQHWITDQAPGEPTIAELVAEHRRLTATIPPDDTDQLAHLRHQITRLEQDRGDLLAATGRWAESAVRHAYQTLQDTQRRHHHDTQRVAEPHLGLLARRRARHAEQASAVTVTQASTVWEQTIEPHTVELVQQIQQLERVARQHEAAQQARAAFLDGNPGIVARITELERAIAHQQRHVHPPAVHSRPAAPSPEPHLELLYAQHAPAVQSPQIHGPSI
jgi:conjugative relaxase-like TrwC/TraI family protein